MRLGMLPNRIDRAIKTALNYHKNYRAFLLCFQYEILDFI